MANDDDDILTAPVPEPDAEASAAERAHAKAFADLVDKALLGRPLPPAMSADDRALLEVATVIRACADAPGLELSASKQRSVVEDALRQAIGGGSAANSLSTTPIESARSRRRRLVPWMIAGTSTLVAAAAIIMLWLRTPPTKSAPPELPVAALPETWRSRPADALIGEIKRAQAADASKRLDRIFADRLEGYRDRRLSGGRP